MSDLDDPLETAWTALLAEWSTPARHDAFVALALSLDRLRDAAARYRSVETDPTLAEAAERGKKLVLARAMAQLDAQPRTTRDEARRHGRWVIPLAALGLMLALSFLLAALTHRREFVSPPALVLEILVVALLPWRRLLR